jgi:hypothetical protein
MKASLILELGMVSFTPGVGAALSERHMASLVFRHMHGDWGVVDAEDRDLNDTAVQVGNRILSAYPIDPNLPCNGHDRNTVWIITEADRSSTNLLLPNEY